MEEAGWVKSEVEESTTDRDVMGEGERRERERGEAEMRR